MVKYPSQYRITDPLHLVMNEMNRPLLTIFNLAFLVLFTGGCKPITSEDPDTVVTAKPEFTIDLYEQRDPANGAATFGIWIESIENYDCADPQIEASATVVGDLISVSILGVKMPSPCVADSVKARRFLAIGQISDGTYKFRLALGPVDAIVNEGTIAVSEGLYTLTLTNVQGIDIQEYVLRRIPESMVWGYASTPDATAQGAADQFLAQVKNVSSESLLPPGFYGYFTISGTNQLSLHKSIAPNAPSESFVRKFDNFTLLQNVITQFRFAPDKPLNIRCFSTMGEI